MLNDEEKNYGELMSFLLDRRRRHGTDERFRAYVAESVQVFARDLLDFGLEIAVEKRPPSQGMRRHELKRLNVGCE